MTIIMQQTIRESINDGRTQQTFEKGARYDVPTAVGQLWIGRGWARKVDGSSGLSGSSGSTKQTKQTKQTGPTREE